MAINPSPRATRFLPQGRRYSPVAKYIARLGLGLGLRSTIMAINPSPRATRFLPQGRRYSPVAKYIARLGLGLGLGLYLHKIIMTKFSTKVTSYLGAI
jgi:hypothetical protein